MDNNNEHAKERALQEQFCLKKISRVVDPFFPHTLMAACIAGKVQTRRKLCKRGCTGKGGSFQAIFNYSEKGGNMLKLLLSQKYFGYLI